MNEHQRQPLGAVTLRVPMAMAEYAAAVGRVHFNCF
jgi:hypothetical protein